MVWLACLERLKTKKWLFDRGIIHDQNEIFCVFCANEIEDVNHLFFHCYFARDLWSDWFKQWHIDWVWNKGFQENFLAWRSPWYTKNQQKTWASGFFVVIWTIWKERNDRLHNHKLNSKEIVSELFWLRMAWWKKGWDADFSYSPDEVARNHQCLLWDEVNSDRSATGNVTWDPPPIGSLKWNVDASQFQNESGNTLAIGGALRDHNGHIMCLFAIPISGVGINDAEYMAILKALELSHTQQLTGNLLIESDSQNAVRWCLNQNRQPWAMNNISNKIQTLLRAFANIKIQYRSRNSNTLADGLAKLANKKRSALIAWI